MTRFHTDDQVAGPLLSLAQQTGAMVTQVQAQAGSVADGAGVCRHTGGTIHAQRAGSIAGAGGNDLSEGAAADIAHADKHQPVYPVPIYLTIGAPFASQAGELGTLMTQQAPFGAVLLIDDLYQPL